jgi:Flp pilus assembly pilin Flp
MRGVFDRLAREESGQDLVEYGLLLGIITVVSVGTIMVIGSKTKDFYVTLCNAVGATGC